MDKHLKMYDENVECDEETKAVQKEMCDLISDLNLRRK